MGGQTKRFAPLVYALDAVIVMAIVVAIGFLALGGAKADNAGCAGRGSKHNIDLQDDHFSEATMSLQRCDSVHITNRDSQSYDINFGSYNDHIDYPGFQASALIPGQSLDIKLVKSGKYELHDHFRDQAVVHLQIK